MLGAEAPFSNSGKLRTNGFELTLNWKDRIGKVDYSVQFQLSDAVNKLVEYGGADTYRLGLNENREGYPMNSYFAYVYDGVPKIEIPLNTASEELYTARSTQREIIDLIIADLDKAIPLLPTHSQLTTDELGRTTRGAALALKARAALYEGTWERYHQGPEAERYIQLAIEAAQAVVDSKEYALFRDKGDQKCLTQRVVYHNPGKQAYPWMSWSNAALPCAPDTRYDFPQGTVLSHASTLDTIDWKTAGTHHERDIKEMTGYFWITKDVNAFGAYTPSLGSGLYHIADESVTPGIKLWSYGIEEDKEWSMLSTPNRQPYVEIQGGPIGDQSIKLELRPGEKRHHVEYWLPTDRPLDIYSLQVPTSPLRPIDRIPLFDWAREEETAVWIALADAYRKKTPLPHPPAPEDGIWPPSGMEDLDEAFRYAIRSSHPPESATWQYHYGTWLAGRERLHEAIQQLSGINIDLAKALLARLYAHKQDWVNAREAYAAITASSVSFVRSREADKI